MAGLNFIGSYSGIDSSAIEQLMQAEKLPLVQLSNKKTDITAKQNAWKDINTRLNSLFEKLKALQNNETFTSKASKSSNDSIVTMTASKNAIEGIYNIKVLQLASNTRYIGKTVNAAYNAEGKIDLNKPLGINGSFTITNANGVSVEIKVNFDSEANTGDSLKDVVNKINAASKEIIVDGKKTEGTGISATIIDGRITLVDEKTGNRTITLKGDGNSTLTNLGLNMAARKEVPGSEAVFTINDITVTRDTNSISNVIEGVTINLNKANLDEEVTVTISQDTSKITKAIQDFVDQYNSTMRFIEDKLSAGNPDSPGSRGTLAGDSSLQRLHSSLRNLVTSSIGNSNTDIKDISQLGVTTIDKFGQLQFNTSKLTEALEKDPQNVMNFFTSKNADNEEIGFAERLKSYVDSFISSKDGIIKGKNESFDKTLKDLNRQIDRFNDRMERKEAYYTKMFAALDVALMQSESQMAWLQGQIQAMNAQAAANKK